MSNVSHMHEPRTDAPRLEEDEYNGFKIQILQTDRDAFLWEFNQEQIIYHSGEENSLADARRAAHEYIDEVMKVKPHECR